MLEVKLARELPSFWDSIIGNGTRLEQLFRTARKITKSKYDDILIVLPDTIFSLISCYQVSSRKMLMDRVTEVLNVPKLDEFYICTPIEIKPPFQSRTTVYAIARKYVDKIINAAQKERATLISIEPASMAFIRGYRHWQIDYPIIEMFGDESTMVTFSPIGGVIRNDAPHMGEKELLANEAKAQESIIKSIHVNRFSCGEAFGSMTPDAQYIVLSENPQIHNIPAIKHNELEEPIYFPDFVDSSLLPRQMHVHWMCAVGTLLQNYPDSMTLYSGKNASTVITTSNLLPKEFQAEARSTQLLKTATNTLRLLVAALAVVLFGTVAGDIYYSMIEIPPSLQADHDMVTREMQSVEKELKCLTDAKQSNPEIMEAYGRILQAKPSDCKFTKLTIGSRSDAGFGGNQYVVITAVSKDEMVFSDYITALQKDRFFISPSLMSIRAEKSSSVKTATVHIGKGGAKVE